MTELLLDLGNSAVKWAVPGPAGWRTGRLAYPGSAEATAEALSSAWPVPQSPCRIRMASVCTPAWQRRLTHRLAAEWPGAAQLQLRSGAAAAGVHSGYREPGQLGADRWAALIGARALAPEGACILDAGTAIAVDGIDAEGRHLGGAIFPGPRLLGNALAHGTAALPPLEPGATETVPADSTARGIAGGVAVGVGGAARALAERVLAACPAGARRLVTGGAAPLLLDALGPGWEHRPHLVLEGLLAWGAGHDDGDDGAGSRHG